METSQAILCYTLFVVAYSQTGQTPAPTEEDDGVWGTIVAIVLIACLIIGAVCCVICCIYQMIKCLCKSALKCVKSLCKCAFSIICCPFRFTRWCCSRMLKKICFCRGCSKGVGIRGCTSAFNGLSTLVVIARMGVLSIELPIPDDKYSQAFFIILFIFIGFATKAYQSRKANQRAKAHQQSQNIQAQKVKNLQTTILTLSDTVFKVLTAIAIVISSEYSGTDKSGGQSVVYQFIGAATILGFGEEVLEMLDYFLTMTFVFKEDEAEEDAEGFSFDAFGKEEDDGKEQKIESTMDIQKTILWQAAWASIKMLVLLSEQSLAFVAALFLFLGNNNEKVPFMIAVIACSVIIIFVAFYMCCKFQRLSCGLCCKYYCCCFYKCCAEHCETKWIKIDPVENKDAKLDPSGQLIYVNLVVAGGAAVAVPMNAINPPLNVNGTVVQMVVAQQSPQQSPQQGQPQIIYQTQPPQQGQQPHLPQVIYQTQPPSQGQPQVIYQTQQPQQRQSQVVYQTQQPQQQQQPQVIYQTQPQQPQQVVYQSQPPQEAQVNVTQMVPQQQAPPQHVQQQVQLQQQEYEPVQMLPQQQPVQVVYQQQPPQEAQVQVQPQSDFVQMVQQQQELHEPIQQMMPVMDGNVPQHSADSVDSGPADLADIDVQYATVPTSDNDANQEYVQ